MGRRRWRFVTFAAFLLYMIKDAQCQDENDYYYGPALERSFAQVQPPLFPNNRPSTIYDHADNFRVAPPSQQPLYNEGHVRFPSPNYNQNPTPFQLSTGRSQAGIPYYINQPENPGTQRQRYRPSLPYNFQLVHPASTKRPDTSQIHSLAYQHDPSKPEQFLGQITINNPDVDYLQNSNRFKNIAFDSNSLKSNGQSGHITRDEDIDSDNREDLFDYHRVTTYNPNKLVNKQRLNIRPSSSRFNHHDPPVLDEKITLQQSPNKLSPRKTASDSADSKALLDLEPLLEDDISDLSTFRELMKNPHSSMDVEVVQSGERDAFSPNNSKQMDDNLPKDSKSVTVTETTTTALPENKLNAAHENQSGEENEDEYEYYDYIETTAVPATQQHIRPKTIVSTESSEKVTDIYDEYDGTEEPEKVIKEQKSTVTKAFEVVTMKSINKSMVKDDNFKDFVDTSVIDTTELEYSDNTTLEPSSDKHHTSIPADTYTSTETDSSGEDVTSIETPSILGQEVVSVVTTKSVVNGTISIPDVTFPPSTTKLVRLVDSAEESRENDTSVPVTTENWVVLASVQTSRSVSGARFLPFPTVEQEEKKQVLENEDEEDDEPVTHDPMHETGGIINSSSSTENINDKLDSIQSELSSAVLSGSLNKENKNIELITETTTENVTPSTTTQGSLNVFTIRSTLPPAVTEKSLPDPPPVLIKKFTHRVTSSTTPRPKKKPSLVTVMDDLAGLLPPGYKPRLSFKDKRTSTTSTTTTTTTTSTQSPSVVVEDAVLNGTQGRSSGISSKNRVILLDDKSLLPKEYKPKEKVPDDILKKFQGDDHSKVLPLGHKPPVSDSPNNKLTSKPSFKPSILDKIEQVDISAFLPKGFKVNNTATTEKFKNLPNLPIHAKPVDITAFLPPGFKLNETENKENNESSNSGNSILDKFKISDVSSLLPSGFKLNNSKEETSAPSSSTTKAPGGIKLVFPSRPGGKVQRKTTPKPAGESGPPPVTPKIQKGWPTRASTEFTGWPSPSTTPFSIEKYLNKTVTEAGVQSEPSTEPTTRRTTTTTTTTPAPPPSTTPGICKKECDIAATIKIVAGVKWMPEFLDHHTDEWQKLAKDVKEELNSVYSKSDLLKKWYKGIRIDGFTQGSVLVDYFIELNNVEDKIDTSELKKLFHKSLHKARPGSVVEVIMQEPSELDPDVMLGDEPDEERLNKSNQKMIKTIDKSAGKLEIGKFVMDPAYTEFMVLPKREEPTIVSPEEDSFLPQWGIAVIVIALASLLFVVIFGVTVLVNRQKSAKAKAPIPLSEDMLRELDKSHMGGFDDMHQMKERDLPYLPSGKRMSTAFIEQLAYPNPGDSWRSEWTPQLQKYMQHYTPDSGRGSQIYGTAGNGYGYGGGGGSQIYGQTGGGSQVYGYTGEYPPPSRSHYSRRRSDYDSNF